MSKLSSTDAAPMKKLSGWPTKGLWIALRLLQVTSKGLVDKEEVGHRAILGTPAKVGAILGTAAEVGADLGAIVGPGVNTVHKATPKMYVPCPLKDPYWEGESPSGTWRQK